MAMFYTFSSEGAKRTADGGIAPIMGGASQKKLVVQNGSLIDVLLGMLRYKNKNLHSEMFTNVTGLQVCDTTVLEPEYH